MFSLGEHKYERLRASLAKYERLRAACLFRLLPLITRSFYPLSTRCGQPVFLQAAVGFLGDGHFNPTLPMQKAELFFQLAGHGFMAKFLRQFSFARGLPRQQ